MERPAPDPHALLQSWMEWERGETPPGRVISNLKTAGMRELLESLAAAAVAARPAGEVAADAGEHPDPEAWTPVV